MFFFFSLVLHFYFGDGVSDSYHGLNGKICSRVIAFYVNEVAFVSRIEAVMGTVRSNRGNRLNGVGSSRRRQRQLGPVGGAVESGGGSVLSWDRRGRRGELHGECKQSVTWLIVNSMLQDSC